MEGRQERDTSPLNAGAPSRNGAMYQAMSPDTALPACRFRVPEEVVSEVIDGEAVVLHLATGKYYAMNRTASRIWQLLRDGVALEGISWTISREFSIDLARARADIEALSAELQARGLLVSA